MVEPKLDYNVSVVLYGRAVQARNESRALRISSANDAVSRMQDCAILAIVLSHATLESAWHWELQAARIGPQPSWPGGLENGIRRVAESRRRSIPPGIPTRHRSDFSLLCAWRNYLQHADAGARRRIAERLGEEFHRHLGANVAEWAVEVLDTYARHFADSMGSQLLGPSELVWAGGTNGIHAAPTPANPNGGTLWERWVPQEMGEPKQ